MSLGRFISTFADPMRTGLCFKDGNWTSTPCEDECTEDQKSSDSNFDYITSQIISNPQFQECSIKNLNNCLTNNYKLYCQSTNNRPTDRPMDPSYSELKLSQHSPKVEFVNKIEKLNNNSEITNVQSDLIYKEIASLLKKKHPADLSLHVDNENLFNNFQFWRTPLPEIELDINTEKCKSENAKGTSHEENEVFETSCTELNLNLSPKQTTM